MVPVALATLELLEVKLQTPVLLDVGGVRAREETLSFAIVTLVNEPMVGFGAVIVSVVDAVALFQLLVANWVALMVIVPASSKVRVAAESVAI